MATSSDTSDQNNVKSRRPAESAFKQQRLPAWQPILTAGTVLPTFFVIGIAFIPVGIGLLYFSDEVKEHVIDYTKCMKKDDNIMCWEYIKQKNNAQSACKCEMLFNLTEDFKGDVYFYYGLSNYYQNHRRYVKSRDDNQLLGRLDQPLSTDCDPFSSANENGVMKPIAPCGAIANSLFNDTLTLNSVDQKKDVPVSRTGIAWDSDKNIKFRNPPGDLKTAFENFTKPTNWAKHIWQLDEIDQNNNGFQNEDLIVWMRTAALPTFRKLYRRVNHSAEGFREGLMKGLYNLTIEYNYPVTDFDGTKTFIISTTSLLGGKNPFLGVAYVVVGTLCLLLGIVLLIIHVRCSKRYYPTPTESFFDMPAQISSQTRYVENLRAVNSAYSSGTELRPSDQPATVPAETDRPATMPAETHQPVTMPAETHQPVTMPAETDQPATMPAETDHPTDPVPAKTDRPNTVPAEIDRPATVPSETDRFATVPAEIDQLATVPATTNPNIDRVDKATDKPELKVKPKPVDPNGPKTRHEKRLVSDTGSYTEEELSQFEKEALTLEHAETGWEDYSKTHHEIVRRKPKSLVKQHSPNKIASKVPLKYVPSPKSLVKQHSPNQIASKVQLKHVPSPKSPVIQQKPNKIASKVQLKYVPSLKSPVKQQKPNKIASKVQLKNVPASKSLVKQNMPNKIGSKVQLKYAPAPKSLVKQNMPNKMASKVQLKYVNKHKTNSNIKDKNKPDLNTKNENKTDLNIKDDSIKDENKTDVNIKNENIKDENKNKPDFNIKYENKTNLNIKDENMKDENKTDLNIEDKKKMKLDLNIKDQNKTNLDIKDENENKLDLIKDENKPDLNIKDENKNKPDLIKDENKPDLNIKDENKNKPDLNIKDENEPDLNIKDKKKIKLDLNIEDANEPDLNIKDKKKIKLDLNIEDENEPDLNMKDKKKMELDLNIKDENKKDLNIKDENEHLLDLNIKDENETDLNIKAENKMDLNIKDENKRKPDLNIKDEKQIKSAFKNRKD